MRKKYLKYCILFLLLLSVTACSKDKSDNNKSEVTPEPTTEVEEDSDLLEVTPEEKPEQDSSVIPIKDEDTGYIHFQGFVYEINAEEAAIVGYDWIDQESVVLPELLTYEEKEYPVTEIGEEAFFYCSDIINLIIPASIQVIGINAFYGCSEISTIQFESGLKRIEDGAFYGCSGLTEIVLPEGLEYIGNEVFCSNSLLSKITIPDTVMEIGVETFFGCTELKSIKLPAKLTNLSNGLFSSCENLTEVILPEGLLSIGEEVFWYCSSLTTVELPESLTNIGSRAFYVAGIKELTIPLSTNINEETFDGCDELEKLTVSKERVNSFKKMFEDSNVKIVAAEK